jgi:hypothetical protein
MSRRIHKAIGYGITGLKSESHRFVDSRLRAEGYLMSDYEDRAEQFTVPGYIAWLRNKINVAGDNSFETKFELSRLTDPDVKLKDLEHSVVYQIEFGLPDTLLIVPPHLVRSWTRYDDEIDYHVESLRPDAGSPRVDILPTGIAPYSDRFWDRRNGKILPYSALSFRLPHQKELVELAKCLGFKDEQEAIENVRPVVPETVTLLCEYLCLFDNPETARYLEPMVVTYWA